MVFKDKEPGVLTYLLAFILIIVIPGLLLTALIIVPESPKLQAILLGATGVLAVILFFLDAIGQFATLFIDIKLSKTSALAALLILGVAAAVLIMVGFRFGAFGSPKSPANQTRQLLTYLYQQLNDAREGGTRLPNDNEFYTFLAVTTGDPYKLSDHANANTGVPVDSWDNPIYYKRGSFNKFVIWPGGPNGTDDNGKVDDIKVGDLIVLDLNPTDEIIDGVKGIFKREDAPADND